ncbi:MAG: hypothetical protein ACI82Z_001404 [Cellvibrionaceae bacterium]|jgi:hypothetical protein
MEYVYPDAFKITDLIILSATIIAALIGAFLLLYIHKVNMTREAKSEFISSIYTILEGIYPKGTEHNSRVFQSLKEAQSKLLRAVSIFRFYIPKSNLEKFNETWHNYIQLYRGCTKEANAAHAFYGDGCSPYEKICACIDELLQYAKT